MKKIKNFKLFESNDYDDLYVIIGINDGIISIVENDNRITDMRLEDLSDESCSVCIFYNKEIAISKCSKYVNKFRKMEVKSLSYLKKSYKMKYLISYKLFESRDISSDWSKVLQARDVSLFTNDEVIDIENMFLEYADKYKMVNLKFEHDEDDDIDYAYYDIEGPEFQYDVARYRNVAIDIYYTGEKIKSIEIMKDIKDNFIPRLKKFGYDIIHFGESFGNWHSNGDIDDDKREITLTITKRN